jgi:hypothetical protein
MDTVYSFEVSGTKQLHTMWMANFCNSPEFTQFLEEKEEEGGREGQELC